MDWVLLTLAKRFVLNAFIVILRMLMVFNQRGTAIDDHPTCNLPGRPVLIKAVNLFNIPKIRIILSPKMKRSGPGQIVFGLSKILNA